jgi:hypothetical protein
LWLCQKQFWISGNTLKLSPVTATGSRRILTGFPCLRIRLLFTGAASRATRRPFEMNAKNTSQHILDERA